MIGRRLLSVLVACCFAAGCASAAGSPPASNPAAQHVVGSNAHTYRVGELSARHAWTVLVFFSATCPTVTAHDQRLKGLWRDFRSRGVGFYAIASEAGFTPQHQKREAALRAYPFPLLVDPRSALARHLNVRYASQVFVLEPEGAVVYTGSIDSDRRFLHDNAKPYLRHALDALIGGFAPVPADSAAYGCALQLESVD